MYKVSTYNLTADLLHAQSDLGSNELGSITSEQLFKVLEQFRALDAVENNSANPRLDVSTAAGRFNVHTSSGKLFLVDTSDPSRMSRELTALDMLDALNNPNTTDSQTPQDPQAVPVASPKKGINHGIAFAMLVVGLALNGYTLYSAFYIEDINVALPLVLLTEKSEIRKQTEILSGTYATGNDVGDRSIVVGSDGIVRLQEFAAKGMIRTQTNHPFGLGKRDEKLYLAIKPRGQIEVSNRDMLVLYGDTYRRVK